MTIEKLSADYAAAVKSNIDQLAVSMHDAGLMRVRKHCGGLIEALATVRWVPATKKGLRDYFKEISKLLPYTDEQLDNIELKLYLDEGDSRIDWDKVYVVLIDGMPVGFTDGPLLKEE